MNRRPIKIISAILFLAVSLSAAADVAPRDFGWWRDGRFGMFIHWGPAALSGKEISWSRNATGIEKYDALYKEFNPVKFNAAEWVATAKAAGMKYMVLTAKHHDGFMLWDTKTGDYIKLPPLPAKVSSAALFDGTSVPFQQDAAALQLSIPEAGRDPNITVVKLTIDGDPMALSPIVPASSSKSLAYLKPATASSSIAPQFMHTAQAVLDDDDSTYWTPGRDETLANEILGKNFEHVRIMPSHPLWIRNGWIEVDLESPTSVTHARIHEYGGYVPVSSWKIEYDADGEWRIAAEGTTIGKRLDVPFPAPVTARKFRLLIEAGGRPALSEFQLFQDSPQ